MAVESPINADANWFVGEDRTLRFEFEAGNVTGIETWQMVLELFAKRAKFGDPPLWASPPGAVVGYPPTPTSAATAVIVVPAAATFAAGPGVVQFVLRRTDPGAAAVLSYGGAHLRSVVQA